MSIWCQKHSTPLPTCSGPTLGNIGLGPHCPSLKLAQLLCHLQPGKPWACFCGTVMPHCRDGYPLNGRMDVRNIDRALPLTNIQYCHQYSSSRFQQFLRSICYSTCAGTKLPLAVALFVALSQCPESPLILPVLTQHRLL